MVNTMSEATLNAVADHGNIRDDSIHGTDEQSQVVLDDLAALGIDYDAVVQVLEDQGVAAFDAGWDHLGSGSPAHLLPEAAAAVNVAAETGLGARRPLAAPSHR